MNEHFIKNFIPANDSIDFLFADYFSSDRIKIREYFNVRNKKLDIESLSYRILNHWEKCSLIDVDRGEEGKGWRKFSLIDAIWIQLIVELRKFGVSIENIKKIYDKLRNEDIEFFPSFYPHLEFYTATYFLTRTPTYLMIFNDFDILIANQNEIDAASIIGSIGNHIRISLHDIIQTVFKNKDMSPSLEYNNYKHIRLSENEITLLLEIRTGLYRAITVKMKDGKMVRFEKEMDKNDKTLNEILKEKNFDKIILDRENGDSVNITQIIKQKI